jgi:hypothetical protein
VAGEDEEVTIPLMVVQLCVSQAAVIKVLRINDQAGDVPEDAEVLRRKREIVAVRGATVTDDWTLRGVPRGARKVRFYLPDLPRLKRADHPSLGELPDAPVGDGAGGL